MLRFHNGGGPARDVSQYAAYDRGNVCLVCCHGLVKMRKLAKSQLGAIVFFASSHPSESCGSNGLPLTPNSIKVVGKFQILRTIEHPHLCKYVSIVRGKHERLIVVSEYYSHDLREEVKLGRLDNNPTKIIQIAFEVLRGLAYLNKYGIIHRYLTPENILLDDESHVKLAKFGMYHMTDNGTSVSFPIGFPTYFAPEVIASGPVTVSDHLSPPTINHLGPKVDVWSLGMILAEAVLGIEFMNGMKLEDFFVRLMEVALSENCEKTFLTKIAEKYNVEDKLHDIDENLKKFIEMCLQVFPNNRPNPEELLNLPIFSSNWQNCLPEIEINSFPSVQSRCKNLEISKHIEQFDDDHLGQRSIDEVFYLWQLAGGDLDSELKKQGIVKMMSPICSLPKIVCVEGEFFGRTKDRAFLLDETVVFLSLDQLQQRLSNIRPEAYYPLIIEESKLSTTTPDSNDIAGIANLPLIIREKDIEYQFHRIILFERLLNGYPFTRPYILKEANIDIPPLYRPHVWAALLEIEGDVRGKYDSIDKETPTATDRQIEVDIPRCHQYDELLSSPEGHAKFKRLLKAWVVSHPQYVYWQGLDSLCAPFLHLNFSDEALAYCCLSAFISKYLHKFFLKDNSPIIQEYLAVFSHLIAFHDPELTNHLNSIGFIPELYAIPWFLTMYTHMFPLHKIFHLWDKLLLGNSSFPLCIGVAILQQLRDSLLSFGFNECILLFSDMPEINIERCLNDSIKIFRSTPRSATYRQYEKPRERKKMHSSFPSMNERIQSELEMDPIPLEVLKSETSPRISAADLLELLELKNTSKKAKSIKSKILIVDIRSPEEFTRGAIPDSINIPFQTAFSPEGKLNSCPEVSILNAHLGRIIIVVGKQGNNAVNFADQIVRLGYYRVCTLQKGIDVLRSTGILVVPATVTM